MKKLAIFRDISHSMIHQNGESTIHLENADFPG
jgi:hypothetical protein